MKYSVRINEEMKPVDVVLTFQEYIGLEKTFEKLSKQTDNLLEIRNQYGNVLYTNKDNK